MLQKATYVTFACRFVTRKDTVLTSRSLRIKEMSTSQNVPNHDSQDIIIDSFYAAPVLNEWVPYCSMYNRKQHILYNWWHVDTHLRQIPVQHWRSA